MGAISLCTSWWGAIFSSLLHASALVPIQDPTSELLRFVLGTPENQALVRVDLDITGDGLPEIFLQKEDERAGRIWSIYSPGPDGGRWLGTIQFHTNMFRFDPQAGTLTVWENASGGRYRKIVYRAGSAGIERVWGKEFDSESDPELDAEMGRFLRDREERRVGFHPPVVVALPEEIDSARRGEPMVWRDLNSRVAVEGLFPLTGWPEDATVVSGSAEPAAAGSPLLAHFSEECMFYRSRDTKVALLELDVTGDGVAEIFLSSDESKGVAGQEWCVYAPLEEATMGLRFMGRLFFHQRGFRVDQQTGEFVVWVRSRGSVGQEARYRIGSSGLEAVSSGAVLDGVSSESERTWQKFVAWRQDGRGRVLTTEAGVLFGKGRVPWREVATDTPVTRSGRPLADRWVLDEEP